MHEGLGAILKIRESTHNFISEHCQQFCQQFIAVATPCEQRALSNGEFTIIIYTCNSMSDKPTNAHRVSSIEPAISSYTCINVRVEHRFLQN